MLTISENVTKAFEAESLAAWRGRVIDYLRETAPTYIVGLDDGELIRRIAACEKEAEALGLVSECDIMRWTFLQTMAGHQLFERPEVRNQFDPGYSGRMPSEMLDLLFDSLGEHLRRQS